MAIIAVPQASIQSFVPHEPYNINIMPALASRKAAPQSSGKLPYQFDISRVSAPMFTNPESASNNGHARSQAQAHNARAYHAHEVRARQQAAAAAALAAASKEHASRSRSQGGRRPHSRSPPHSFSRSQFHQAAGGGVFTANHMAHQSRHGARTHHRQSSLTTPQHSRARGQRGVPPNSMPQVVKQRQHSVPHIMYPDAHLPTFPGAPLSLPPSPSHSQQVHMHAQRIAALQQQQHSARARGQPKQMPDQRRRQHFPPDFGVPNMHVAAGHTHHSRSHSMAPPARPTKSVARHQQAHSFAANAARGPDQSLVRTSQQTQAHHVGPTAAAASPAQVHSAQANAATPRRASQQAVLPATPTLPLAPQNHQQGHMNHNLTTVAPTAAASQPGTPGAVLPSVAPKPVPMKAQSSGAPPAAVPSPNDVFAALLGAAHVAPNPVAVDAPAKPVSPESIELPAPQPVTGGVPQSGDVPAHAAHDSGNESDSSSSTTSSLSSSSSAPRSPPKTPTMARPKRKKSADEKHKTRYFATPAYQAKPNIAHIPLPSFLTHPRFNRTKKTQQEPKKAATEKKKLQPNGGAKEAQSEPVSPKNLASDMDDAASSTSAVSEPSPVTVDSSSLLGAKAKSNILLANGPPASGAAPRSVSLPGSKVSSPSMPPQHAKTASAGNLAPDLSLSAPPLARGQTHPSTMPSASHAVSAPPQPPMPMPASTAETKNLFVEFINNVRKYRESETAYAAAKIQQQQQKPVYAAAGSSSPSFDPVSSYVQLRDAEAARANADAAVPAVSSANVSPMVVASCASPAAQSPPSGAEEDDGLYMPALPSLSKLRL